MPLSEIRSLKLAVRDLFLFIESKNKTEFNYSKVNNETK
ncbi:hypothetical protein SAMN06265218_113119 [Fodinibius sediminis]|uniref:Uncharacterized protein n=1 Tax=Fodinibius sediminis TaxID=1214077 RepID=A0A521E5W4_9BACT|nr:hypothetical protein SAMN06265218_113119 [Fodinibius sediminis]